MMRNFPEYPWSTRTLDRHLRYFSLHYTDYNVSVLEIQNPVEVELTGPGKHLGYRAMHLKIRQKHGLNIPRDVVYAAICDFEADGLENRAVGVNKNKKLRGHFTTKGTNFVHSIDGHAKLVGYQKDMFPLAIVGMKLKRDAKNYPLPLKKQPLRY